MPKWIGGSAISITRYWVKEFTKEGEPALRRYIEGMREQYRATKAAGGAYAATELADLAECGKFAAAAYRREFGRDCA